MKKALLVTSSLMLIAGCSDESSKEKGDFLSGCMRNGASKAICECTFNKLEEIYTLQGLLRKAEQPTEQFISTVVQVSQECKDR